VGKHTALDPLIGALLGHRYELVARIARGGMATVYRGHDRQLDRVVAVKVPRPEMAGDQRFCEQFRREARAAARLGHPNVVNVYDSGDERGLPYMVMEHVTGRTMRDLLDTSGRLTPDATADLLAGVAAALDHAHANGVVHLDVKPENVLLTADTVKVADFGLVRAARARSEHELAGTAQYVAPEVLRGGVVDGRADVYALGVVAYECITGQAPFDGPDRDEVARRHLTERVPPPSRIVPGLAAAVDYAVLVATEPDPDRRYRRASDFTAAIGARQRRWSDEAASATTVVPPSAGAIPTVAGVAGVAGVPAPAEAAMAVSRGATVATGLGGGRTDPPGFVPGWEEHEPPRLRPTIGHQPKSRTTAMKLGAVAFVIALVASGVYAWEFLVPRTTTMPNVVGDTLEQARAELEAEGLRVSTGEPVADRKVPQGRVAAQSIPAGRTARHRSVIEINLSSGLPFVVVPAIAGQSEEEALASLKRARLEPKVVRDTDEKVAEGEVIRSTPAGPARVQEGGTVTVVVSSGPPKVAVPEVAGVRADEARETLESAGLTVRERREPSDEVEEGDVIRTEPGPGTQVDADGTVTLVVSSGDSRVEVPDVEGLDRDEAVRILDAAGLRATISVEDLFRRRVDDQDPDAGTEVDRGSQVRLNLD
jgi:eukaryotic-like serine/threonine-protein kinase